ncbi:MAG: T9SS type A sorting domain-containing protein [Saprospiraceae bacterium]|nr:T9SS type A sorting domain-containing protein [Saprospiraceae bacterium]
MGPNGRKSWSWVPNLDVGAFINSPFSNVYGDPYTPHIYFSNLSRNQIINASANYFKLHAIKNGDIISIDGLGSGHNSWICGAGAYLHSNNTESRSYGQGYLGSTRLSTGDRVQLAVVLDQTPDSLGSLQFALKLPSNLGEIKQISFQGGLNSKWHYNRESGRLTVLCFYDIPGQHIRYTPGDIMNIEIGVTRDADISNIVGWVDNFNEVTKFSGDIFDTDFNLEIRNIIRSTFDIDILSTPNVEAIINSPVSESANIRITDLSGRVLESRSFYLKEGLNKYESNLNLQAGMYIFSVFSIGDSPKSIKFIR